MTTPELSAPGHPASLERLTAALSRALTSTEVTEAAVDRGTQALGAGTGGMWLVEGSGQVAHLVRQVGYTDRGAADFRRLPLSPGSGPVIDAIVGGEPVWIESARAFAARYPAMAAVVTRRPEMAIASLPMMVEGRCLGALVFTFDVIRRFDEDERRVLLLLSGHCEQALRRARLFDAERRARAAAEASQSRMALLAEVSRAAAEAQPELEPVLSAIAEVITRSFADGVVFDVLWEDGRGLRPVAFHHRAGESAFPAREILVNGSAWGEDPLALQVLRNGEPAFAPVLDPAAASATAPASLRPRLDRFGVRSLVVVPLRATEGKATGTLTAFRDHNQEPFDPADLIMLQAMAHRAGLAAELACKYSSARRARDRAEDARRAREELLALLSSDLKKPLGTLKNKIAALVQATAEGSLQHELEIALHAADRMDRLMHDLVDYAHLGSAAGPARIPHELASVLEGALAPLRSLAGGRALEVRFGPRAACARVVCDRDRFERVFAALVDNAIKLTPEDAVITVDVTIRPGEVVFAVDDSTPADPQPLPRLGLPHRRESLGLGLYLSQALVEAQGGRLWTETHPATGRRLCFALPAHQA